MKKQRLYIAGHIGMVGTALCDYFKTDNRYELITATRQELDLTNQKDTYQWLNDHKPDITIIAAAKVGGIQANINEPNEFLYQNLEIACNTIQGSFLAGVPRLIFLGSSCMYPKNCPQPMKEDDLLTGAFEPTNEGYAIAKVAGWKLCQTLREQHGLDYGCVIPCNLYGPNDHFDPVNSHVIPAQIRRFFDAKKQCRKSVEIWGTGNPRREFLHVYDLAKAIDLLLVQNTLPSVINIGSGVDISIQELVYIIKDIYKYNGDIHYDHSKPDGMALKCMDISKIIELGWEPTIDLKEGLESVCLAFDGRS